MQRILDAQQSTRPLLTPLGLPLPDHRIALRPLGQGCSRRFPYAVAVVGRMSRYDAGAMAPTRRENWLAQFKAELLALRPAIGQNLAQVIASNEWRGHRELEPRQAAKLWAQQTVSKA